MVVLVAAGRCGACRGSWATFPLPRGHVTDPCHRRHRTLRYLNLGATLPTLKTAVQDRLELADGSSDSKVPKGFEEWLKIYRSSRDAEAISKVKPEEELFAAFG